jgi:hypothetical protein
MRTSRWLPGSSRLSAVLTRPGSRCGDLHSEDLAVVRSKRTHSGRDYKLDRDYVEYSSPTPKRTPPRTATGP